MLASKKCFLLSPWFHRNDYYILQTNTAFELNEIDMVMEQFAEHSYWTFQYDIQPNAELWKGNKWLHKQLSLDDLWTTNNTGHLWNCNNTNEELLQNLYSYIWFQLMHSDFFFACTLIGILLSVVYCYDIKGTEGVNKGTRGENMPSGISLNSFWDKFLVQHFSFSIKTIQKKKKKKKKKLNPKNRNFSF